MTQFLRRLVCAVTLGFVGTSISSAQGGGSLDTAALWGVAHHDGTWIAVGEQGVITKSVDALNWTNGTLAPASASTWLLAVARGDPGWVVVGDGGVILFSADGTTWEQVATGGVRLNGVAWGGGRFLAVGEAGTVRTSTDGRNWSAPQQVMPEGFLRAVAYGDGVFLVGGQQGRLFRTADGVAFEELVVTDLNIEALTWDGRFFQAVGEAGMVMQSRNGELWATPQWGTPHPAMGYLRGVVVERNSLVAVGVAGQEVSSFAAGGGRVTHTSVSSVDLNAAAGGGGKVVAVGALRTRIARDVPTDRSPQVALATEQQPRYQGQTLVIEAGQLDGSGPFSYQWLKDGQAIAGATSDRLVLAGLASADAGRYALRVTNAVGSATSSELPVEVTFAPPTQFNDPAYRAMDIRPAVGRSGGEVGGVVSAQRQVELSGTVNSVFLTGVFVAPAAQTPVPDSGPPRYGVAMLNNSGLRGSEPYYGQGISPYFKLPWRLVVGAKPQVFRTDEFYSVVAADYYPSVVQPRKVGLFSVSTYYASRLLPDPQSFNYASALPVDRAAQIKQALRDSQGRILVAYERPGTSGVTELMRIKADATRDTTFPVTELPGTGAVMRLTEGDGLTWAVNRGDAIEYGSIMGDGVSLATSRGTIDLADFFPPPMSRPRRSLHWVGEWGNTTSALLQLTAETGDSVSSDARTALFYFSGLRIWAESTGVGLIEGGATLTPIADDSMRWGYFARRRSGTPLSGSEAWQAGTIALVNGAWATSPLAEGSTPFYGDNAVPVDGVVDHRGGLFLKKGDTIKHVLPDGSEDPRFSIPIEHPRAAGFRMDAVLGAYAGGPAFYLRGDFDGINGSPSRGVAYLGYYDPNEQFDPRFVNVAVRAQAGSGEQQLIVGFVARGASSSRVLVRALGPGLSDFGVNGVLVDPRLQLRAGAVLVAENDNWSLATASTFVAAGAFPLTEGSADAAADPVLAPRDYTLAIGGASGGSGIVLGEVYRSPATSAMTVGEFRMFNVSARAPVGEGEKTLIAGFALRGNGTRRVLVRGVGPALVSYGVTGVLSQPVLRVYADDELIAENRQWDADTRIAGATTRAGAFPLVEGSKDAAILIDLPPGEYTATISGENGATGIALVEVYEVK